MNKKHKRPLPKMKESESSGMLKRSNPSKATLIKAITPELISANRMYFLFSVIAPTKLMIIYGSFHPLR
jgi:hypothetical protein